MRHIKISLILMATLFLANGCTLDRELKTYNGVSVQKLGYISGVSIEGSFPEKANLAVNINSNLSSKYEFQVVSVNSTTVGGIRQVQVGLMGSNRKPVVLEYPSILVRCVRQRARRTSAWMVTPADWRKSFQDGDGWSQGNAGTIFSCFYS